MGKFSFKPALCLVYRYRTDDKNRWCNTCALRRPFAGVVERLPQAAQVAEICNLYNQEIRLRLKWDRILATSIKPHRRFNDFLVVGLDHRYDSECRSRSSRLHLSISYGNGCNLFASWCWDASDKGAPEVCIEGRYNFIDEREPNGSRRQQLRSSRKSQVTSLIYSTVYVMDRIWR